MKNTWKILKHAIGIENKDSTVEIINSEGQQISNTCEIVEAFNEHFVKVSKRIADEIPQSVCSPTANIDKANTRFEFMEISASNIVKLIKKLISGKATGLDGIPNKALKDSAELIASSLSDIFNFSVSTKTYPDDFKVAKFIPIFNPIAYGGGGFLVHAIRLSAITLEPFHLGSPNFLTPLFYSLDTLWRNFRS